MKDYKIGDKFIAQHDFPEDMREDVKNDMASFDIVKSEEFEIIEMVDDDYRVFNHALGQPSWCMMSRVELENTITD